MTKQMKKKANQHWLDIGMNVLFNHQVGVIKYIGRVEFSDGVWLGELNKNTRIWFPFLTIFCILGLEMRDHVGRHDGQVQGHRYFQCRGKYLYY